MRVALPGAHPWGVFSELTQPTPAIHSSPHKRCNTTTRLTCAAQVLQGLAGDTGNTMGAPVACRHVAASVSYLLRMPVVGARTRFSHRDALAVHFFLLAYSMDLPETWPLKLTLGGPPLMRPHPACRGVQGHREGKGSCLCGREKGK